MNWKRDIVRLVLTYVLIYICSPSNARDLCNGNRYCSQFTKVGNEINCELAKLLLTEVDTIDETDWAKINCPSCLYGSETQKQNTSKLIGFLHVNFPKYGKNHALAKTVEDKKVDLRKQVSDLQSFLTQLDLYVTFCVHELEKSSASGSTTFFEAKVAEIRKRHISNLPLESSISGEDDNSLTETVQSLKIKNEELQNSVDSLNNLIKVLQGKDKESSGQVEEENGFMLVALVVFSMILLVLLVLSYRFGNKKSGANSALIEKLKESVEHLQKRDEPAGSRIKKYEGTEKEPVQELPVEKIIEEVQPEELKPKEVALEKLLQTKKGASFEELKTTFPKFPESLLRTAIGRELPELKAALQQAFGTMLTDDEIASDGFINLFSTYEQGLKHELSRYEMTEDLLSSQVLEEWIITYQNDPRFEKLEHHQIEFIFNQEVDKLTMQPNEKGVVKSAAFEEQREDAGDHIEKLLLAEVGKIQVYYFTYPNRDGFFWDDRKSEEGSGSDMAYEIQIDPSNPDEATLGLLTEKHLVMKDMIRNYPTTLEPVCSIDPHAFNKAGTVIKVTTLGKVVKEGNHWRVKAEEDKIKIQIS
jgi:hypothetical protein